MSTSARRLLILPGASDSAGSSRAALEADAFLDTLDPNDATLRLRPIRHHGSDPRSGVLEASYAFRDGRCHLDPARSVEVFQPTEVHVFGLGDAVSRVFVDVASRVDAAWILHRCGLLDGLDETGRSLLDFLESTTGRHPPWRPPIDWRALDASWKAPADAVHPVFAALVTRLVGGSDPESAGERAERAVRPVDLATEPATGPRTWKQAIGRRIATPITQCFLDIVHPSLERSRALPSRRRVAEEMERIVGLLTAREKRSLRGLRQVVLPSRKVASPSEVERAQPRSGASKRPTPESARVPATLSIHPERLDGWLDGSRFGHSDAESSRASEPAAGDRRPAILVLTPRLSLGGAERQLLELLYALRDRLAFTVATLLPHESQLGDTRTSIAALAPLYDLGALERPRQLPALVDRLAARIEAQVVYGANGCGPLYACFERLRERRPHLRIVDHLYDDREGFIQRYRNGEPAAVDLCLVETERIAEELRETRGWPAASIRCLPACGRRSEDLPAIEERTTLRHRIREELQVAPEDLLILTAARLHEQKRPFDILALASRLRDLRHVQFLWVGGGPLAPAFDRHLAWLQGSTPRIRVRRLPFRSDVLHLLAAADAGCLVSAYEGMPVFLVECLQLGVPFLATGVGGARELSDQTGAGLLVDFPGDLVQLERQARRLYESSELRALTERARAASSRFGTEARAETFLDAVVSSSRSVAQVAPL